ncbi:MAG: siderophore-interacting protein [Propionibacteriaceae bacterium]|jgi:NADPH-dependent ferric siderophore reductase|nr:siderophore-interacting protein [Propionibacteriaceae bacterium]
MAFKDAGGQRGLYLAEVGRAERISPHIIRVTIKGDDLRRLPRRGYDHWFRLFLPRDEGEIDFTALPKQFGMTGYLKFKASGLADRLAVRNYTVRQHRPEAGEVDIDFVSHGDAGIGGVWAGRAQPGDPVALIDQGCGFDPIPDTSFYLLAGDESAQSAILGILRDLPRAARGLALLELPELADAQQADAPEGIDLRWISRADPQATPGAAALAALKEFQPEYPATLTAYLAGEQTLATEGRSHLLSAGVPKSRIAFVGYWRAGVAHP